MSTLKEDLLEVLKKHNARIERSEVYVRDDADNEYLEDGALYITDGKEEVTMWDLMEDA
jgi:septum formation topological specificity factor MinE